MAPYYRKTKEDIIKVFSQLDKLDLVSSAVSCSSTRTKRLMFPHCGCCSQCIDRRIAVFAADCFDHDCQYATDFIQGENDAETSQRLYQQMRFASGKDYSSPFDLMKNYPTEIQDAVEYWPCDNPEDSLFEIHELLERYSDSFFRAVKQIQWKYEDLRNPVAENSFLKIVSSREYLKTPFERRVEEIDKRLRDNIPMLFRTGKPKNENDFNDKIVALLQSNTERWLREYPVIVFGITNYRADSSCDGLIIESKYIRGTTTPSVATNGIASDIMLNDANQSMLFIVYDPEHQIVNDEGFCKSLMSKKQNCFVKIYR